MEELQRISVSLTRDVLAQLDSYARAHRWSRSTAAAVLIEEGLRNQAGDRGQEEDAR
jgi:metal-responsive CopG/Arc/MetJ family transcriptional regulator